jgi:hypothetical protein
MIEGWERQIQDMVQDWEHQNQDMQEYIGQLEDRIEGLETLIAEIKQGRVMRLMRGINVALGRE